VLVAQWHIVNIVELSKDFFNYIVVKPVGYVESFSELKKQGPPLALADSQVQIFYYGPVGDLAFYLSVASIDNGIVYRFQLMLGQLDVDCDHGCKWTFFALGR
jgi:hypothetical protein